MLQKLDMIISEERLGLADVKITAVYLSNQRELIIKNAPMRHDYLVNISSVFSARTH